MTVRARNRIERETFLSLDPRQSKQRIHQHEQGRGSAWDPDLGRVGSDIG